MGATSLIIVQPFAPWIMHNGLLQTTHSKSRDKMQTNWKFKMSFNYPYITMIYRKCVEWCSVVASESSRNACKQLYLHNHYMMPKTDLDDILHNSHRPSSNMQKISKYIFSKLRLDRPRGWCPGHYAMHCMIACRYWLFAELFPVSFSLSIFCLKKNTIFRIILQLTESLYFNY